MGAEGRADLLSFPRLPREPVPRPGLSRRLDRLAPITIVEALPGFGKTTLVASWAREQHARGSRVVWLRATADVADVSTFLHTLHRGLLRGDALHPAVPRPREPDTDMVGWLNDLAHAGKPVIVVVDDAHLLHELTVADVLAHIVEVAHPVHVVVCADAEHHFHRAAAEHGLETNVLLGRDLTVPADQVARFAESWHHRLASDRAGLLHRLVGGWPRALRLVLDATPAWSDQFAAHVADEFLMTEVLPDLAGTGDHATAMRFAVPRLLTPALADALLTEDGLGGSPEPPGRAAIAALERRGLLWRVPRHDGEAQWEFPTLIRRALRAELERTQPEVTRSAHHTVARVLTDSLNVAPRGELLRHGRSAGSWGLLARLWIHEGWRLLGTEPAAFVVAYTDIPSPARQEHPVLAVASTLADALATTMEESDWVTRTETLQRRYMRKGADFLQQRTEISDPGQLVDLLAAGMVARRSEGRLQEARDLALEAARQLARSRAQRSTPERSDQESWFNLQWGVTQMLSGDFGLAIEKTAAAYDLGPDTVIGAGAAALMSAMHAVSGERVEAQRWLGAHENIDISEHWAAGLAELPAHLTRAFLALDRLDPYTAEDALAHTTLASDSIGLWPLALAAHTRYALLFGDPAALHSRLGHLRRVLARQLRDSDGIGRRVYDRCDVELMLALGEVNRVQSRLGEGHDVPPWLCTAAARLHLMTGFPQLAMRVAAANVWRQGVPARDRQDLLVISALACRELGRSDQMLESFRRAHSLTLHTRNLEPFLLLPIPVRNELFAATNLTLDPDDLARLAATPRVYPEQVPLIQLTPRELEVLRQIRAHPTAAALARTLSVSVNTVKKQLVSLYAKLGVHDRSSALLRAERLGLLDEPDEPSVAD